MRKTVKILMQILFVCMMFLTGYERQVGAVATNNVQDTQVGTASEAIERAIAVGKLYVGKVDYRSAITGRDGHGTYEQVKNYTPGGEYGLDCSSFISHIMAKGYGIAWNRGSYTASTWTFSSGTPAEYQIQVSDPSDFKRGDIILVADKSHVIMWLGDNKYLASNGYPPEDLTNGPTIREYNYDIFPHEGMVIRMPAKAETAISEYPDKFVAYKDVMDVDVNYDPSAGGSDQSVGEKAKEFLGGDDAWKDPMIKFEDRQYVMNTKGVRDDKVTKATPAIVVAFTNIANKIWNASHAVVLVGGVALFGYMSVLIIFYMAILPRTEVSNGVLNTFEKLSGTPAYYSKEGLIDLFSKLGITIVVIAILYSNAVPLLFTGVYNIINYLL